MKFSYYLILYALLFSGNISAEGHQHNKTMEWTFDGIRGKFDRQIIQRGYQVYKEVCSACHGLKLVAYRNLTEIGFSEAEVKEIAKEYTVRDGPNDEGEMFDRPATPSDNFVSPYPNSKAARAANNGALPPDLSLIIKARPDGANYVYSVLTGYQDAPHDFKLTDGLHYNLYFANNQIAMPEPLSDNLVTYSDGTKATKDQMAYDVVTFLQWAAEPEMEKRKLIGMKVIAFLVFFTIISYIVKNKIWSRIDNT
jgi:ubiquinol-cytochrome c reductase cytochrome c1 subunit